MPRRALFGAACTAATLCGLAVVAQPIAVKDSTAQKQRFTFGLIGDLGYFPEHEAWVENVFADLNKDESLAFVVHVGDLSSPVFACTNTMVARRLAQFNASIHPLIYTPGDNEWTDCHDPPTDKPGYGIPGGNPLERLAHLRATFFQGEQSLGQKKIALARQSRNSDPIFAKYRENVRWDHAGVTFITIHVVGSNNGRGRTPEADAEYAERNKANIAWLHEGFDHAQTQSSSAVVVITQANIFPAYPPITGSAKKKPSGFTEIRDALEKQTRAFARPVILVHGDTHYFRIDNPFYLQPKRGEPGRPSIGNFLRVETFGTPNHHWLHVSADTNSPGVFAFSPRIVTKNLPSQ
jgi:hypothetical protein